MKVSGLAKYAWGLVGYTLLVVAWGAYVRASNSGDGCGAHWPDCGGQIVPTAVEHTKTWVEYSHRVTSGLMLPLVVGLLIAIFRSFAKGHTARKAAVAGLFFTITEALVGMALVKLGYVAQNTSADRAVWMSIHLINTFLLLASLALCAWFAAGGRTPRFKGQGPIGWALGFGVFGVLGLGVSGAVTALGDTLFPVGSEASWSTTQHFLIELRRLHPMIAVSVGVYLVFVAVLVAHVRPSPSVRRWTNTLITLFMVELALGLVNVLLRAPIWMQLVHLAFADVLWLSLILTITSALNSGAPRRALATDSPFEEGAVPSGGMGVASFSGSSDGRSRGDSEIEVDGRLLVGPSGANSEETERPGRRDASATGGRDARSMLKAYISLTKPRVISLLLFTTLAAMFIAKGGWPGGWLFFWVALGGYAAAGAANAINMIIDRDIDGRMRRTSKRPTVTNEIPTLHASLFALGLAVFSVVSLTWAANLLSAMLAMAGLAFYVVVYTLMLKRRTWHNIVIGGAAGCFPPLVGYAAVAGHLSPLAWCLFAVIFVWTPVHFWALALLIKDDYAEAGVPMLPVVHGERVTVIQIALYSVVTALVSAIPFAQGAVGWVYLGPATVLNAVLVLQSFQLMQKPERPRAVRLFHYSMVYLALLFLVIAIDRSVIL